MQSYARINVSFAMVSFPVALYSTRKTTEALKAKTLTDCHNAPVKQIYTCTHKDCGKMNPETHKGYPVSGSTKKKDTEFVSISKEELESLKPENSGSFQISHFVPKEALGDYEISSSYWVTPGNPKDQTPYATLYRAMQQTGLVGIGSYVSRGSEYCAYLEASHRGLKLVHLVWYDELRPATEVFGNYEIPVADKLVDMASQIITSMESTNVGMYQSEYKARVREAIKEKYQTGKVSPAQSEPVGPPSQDITALLMASLAKVGESSE